MGLERTALDHACNVIRRQVQDEFRDLTLFFVVYTSGKRAQALAQAEDSLLSHEAGKAALGLLKQHEQTDKTEFLGLSTGKKEGLLSFLKNPSFLALFFINADDFETLEDAREQVYHLTWHALDLLERHTLQNKKQGMAKDVITPEYTSLSLSKSNLIADVFTALTFELQGHHGMIQELAQKRSLLTLQPAVGYRAETYPYPIAVETTQMVFEELRDNFKQKTKITGRAFQLAKEVGLTHDDRSIKQWWAFSSRAQEMAWMDFEHEKILSAAIHTSEDPYVRSMAHLVSEAMEIKPGPLAELGTYNPFTDQEVNARAHNKACEESFQRAIAKTLETGEPYHFTEEAYRQNKRLSQGHPIGWCAHALIRAGKAFEQDNPEKRSQAENAAETFHKANSEISWKIMHKISKKIMRIRRTGLEITADELVALGQKNPDFAIIAKAYKETTKGSAPSKEEKETKQKPKEINISDFSVGTGYAEVK